jgi:hypothetical protein
MTSDTSSRFEDLTVAELRRMARERGLKRYSKMKKAELITALQPTAEQRDVARPHDEDLNETEAQTGAEAEGSTWEPDGSWAGDGGSQADERTTIDDDEIRAWAAARDAVPARGQGE